VERHICLLDQAIKEQEASLSQETSRSFVGLGVMLPELPIPEWPRKSRNVAPIEIDGEMVGDQSISVLQKNGIGSEGKDDRGNDSASLVITIPPHPVEKLYCYCNRISFGEVSNLQ